MNFCFLGIHEMETKLDVVLRALSTLHDTQAFLDFRMRRSLAKVLKLRRDRAALPIASFQGAIVHAVASNPCVLVAGDTGCGKSTQVYYKDGRLVQRTLVFIFLFNVGAKGDSTIQLPRTTVAYGAQDGAKDL